METYFHRVNKATPTRFWINNVTEKEADMALEAGAVGCTQNPSYVWRILNGSDAADDAKQMVKAFIKETDDDTEVLVRLQRHLVTDIARHFKPLFEQTKGRWGYVSIQGSPHEEDKDSIIKYARYNRQGAPNLMAKIPVTEDGLEAIRVLAAEGVPINATECMAVRQVLDVCDIYTEVTRTMDNPAPLYFSLITGIFDEYLHNYVAANNVDIGADALWHAGMAVAKKVHALVKERGYNCGFIGGGARGLHHFTEMVGADASITINWIGTADKLIEMNAPVVSRFLQPTPFSIEDELVEKLEDFRKAYFINAIEPHEYEDYGPVELFRNNFVDAWDKALAFVKETRSM